MIDSSPFFLHRRLMLLATHIVVALIALVVIGGATRVMEAGLACPDWPLCYGSVFPGAQMNLRVFLEWFHRLDALLVGAALITQFILALIYRSYLPKWFIWTSGMAVFLVLFQAVLGALTVFNLLESSIVTTHLGIGLVLVALMSGLTQRLGSLDRPLVFSWWNYFSLATLVTVLGQCLIGSRMSTEWASQRCISIGENCQMLDLHRLVAMPVAFVVLTFVLVSFVSGGWFREQWLSLSIVFFLVFAQIALGVFSIRISLSQPLLVVCHQLVAALLIAFLSALSFRSPSVTKSGLFKTMDDNLLEACNG